MKDGSRAEVFQKPVIHIIFWFGLVSGKEITHKPLFTLILIKLSKLVRMTFPELPVV